MFRNFVLGAGVNGLILGHLLQLPVIGQLQGQSHNSFPLGPRILHYGEDSARLINKLNIRKKPRSFKVGHYEGDLSSGNFVNPEQSWRESYALKTRGIKDFASAASAGKSEIVGWDIEDIQLVKKLREKVWEVRAKITKIDVPERVLYFENNDRSVSGALPYDELFNTIDLREFYKITGRFEEARALKIKDVRFVLANSVDLEKLLGTFDYVYFASEDVPFSRITRLHRYIFVIEIPEQNISKNLWGEEGVEIRVLGSRIMISQIIPRDYSVNNLLLKNEDKVHMVGRYARWDHSLLINNTIKEGMAYAEDMCGRY